MAQMTVERFDQPSLPVVVAKPRSGIWRIVREFALLATLFGVYNVGRFLAADHVEAAYRHADDLLRWEGLLGLPSEATVQLEALRIRGLADVANVYYAGVHFPLTAVVLLWLMIRRPAEYGRARWGLASLTGLALIGHTFFPLAPPRLLPGWVDTGVILGQSVYGPTTDSGVANQFAAMPSLHVGWAFMVAVILIRATRSRWRWLWIAHPAITFAVVVVTANHYWLDGLVAIALGLPLLLIFDTRRPSSLVRNGPGATTLVGGGPAARVDIGLVPPPAGQARFEPEPVAPSALDRGVRDGAVGGQWKLRAVRRPAAKESSIRTTRKSSGLSGLMRLPGIARRSSPPAAMAGGMVNSHQRPITSPAAAGIAARNRSVMPLW
jgi:hypothetical protein